MSWRCFNIANLIKKKFKVSDMHCSSCALVIDMDLEDKEGVKCSSTSYASQSVEVEFDEEKIKQEEVLKTINQSGYSATPIDS